MSISNNFNYNKLPSYSSDSVKDDPKKFASMTRKRKIEDNQGDRQSKRAKTHEENINPQINDVATKSLQKIKDEQVTKTNPNVFKANYSNFTDVPAGVKHRAFQATLVKIAEDLVKGTPVSVHKKKNDDQTVESYGYLITDKGDIYIRIATLGEGAIKKVSDTLHLNSGRYVANVAIKATLEHPDPLAHFNEERGLRDKLAELGVRHIPKTHVFIDETADKSGVKKVNVIMEKFTGDGTLLSKMNTKNKLFGLTLVSESLADMHKAGFVHHDVKPENFLVATDDEGNVIDSKISDFGTTGLTGAPFPGGTKAYFPPELLQPATSVYLTTAKPETDSYALGLTIIDTIKGKTIKNFQEMDDISRYEAVMGDYFDLEDANSEDIELQKQILEIAIQLTNPNPEERMTCEEASTQLRVLLAKLP